MKKIKFIEEPKIILDYELEQIKGGGGACNGYSGSCMAFDKCTNNYTGSCSAVYGRRPRLELLNN